MADTSCSEMGAYQPGDWNEKSYQGKVVGVGAGKVRMGEIPGS